MFNEDFEEEGFETDFDIDAAGFSQKTLICGLYLKLNQFERHFDSITTKFKKMLLTWIFATFAAIGFLLSTETTKLPFNHMAGVLIVCFLGLVGNLIIWHLDMNVYHKFWAAIYIEEIVMEKRYHFLIPSRNTAMLVDDSRGRIFSQGLFYIVANILFLIMMGGSAIYLINKYGSMYVFFVSLLFVIALIGSTFFMMKVSKKTKNSFNQMIIKKEKIHQYHTTPK